MGELILLLCSYFENKMPNPKCPRCQKTVYFAEQQLVLGKPWHKICVKCAGCSKKLEPGNFQDREGDIYCKNCYHLKAGIGGYGHGHVADSYQSFGNQQVGKPQTGPGITASGAPVEQAYCQNCGNLITGNFCGQCGNRR